MKKLFFLTVSCIVFVQQAAHAMWSLHEAVEADDVAQVTALLNNSDTDVNLQNCAFGWTPLHWAAIKGNKAVVMLLLKHGANVNQPDIYGRHPLHHAANNGHLAAATVLLENGANINAEDRLQHKTPLYWAMINNHTEVAHVLREWPQPMLSMKAAKITICSAQQPRLGARSDLHQLDQPAIRYIAHFLRPEHFAAQPLAAMQPVAPSLFQQIVTTTQNLLQNRRVQCATAALAIIGFAAWRLLHH